MRISPDPLKASPDCLHAETIRESPIGGNISELGILCSCCEHYRHVTVILIACCGKNHLFLFVNPTTLILRCTEMYSNTSLSDLRDRTAVPTCCSWALQLILLQCIQMNVCYNYRLGLCFRHASGETDKVHSNFTVVEYISYTTIRVVGLTNQMIFPTTCNAIL